MTASQTQQDLVVLENWAPEVLAQKSGASEDDLFEIIERRARVEKEVLSCPRELAAPLLAKVIRTDQKLKRDFYTLLYLPKRKAEEAAAKSGSKLSEVSFWGVHSFVIAEVLEGWSEDLEAQGVEAHPSEILRAFDKLKANRGVKWVNREFSGPLGYRKVLSPEAQKELAEFIRK